MTIETSGAVVQTGVSCSATLSQGVCVAKCLIRSISTTPLMTLLDANANQQSSG